MARPRSRPAGRSIASSGSPRPRRAWGRGDFLPAVGDLERVPAADGRLDLAVSLLALQTVNDLPGALIQMRRALKGDGLLIAAMIGGETLTELRQSLTIAESEILGGASPRVAPFVDVRALGGLAQRAGLALPVVDLDRAVVRYPDMFALFADLRAMGATNALHARSRKPLRREVLLRAPPPSTPSASPIRTGVCARPSISSGSQPGRRMKASRSRSKPGSATSARGARRLTATHSMRRRRGSAAP